MMHILICNSDSLLDDDIGLMKNFYDLGKNSNKNSCYLVFGNSEQKLKEFLFRMNLNDRLTLWFHLGKNRFNQGASGIYTQPRTLFRKFANEFIILNNHPYFLTRGSSNKTNLSLQMTGELSEKNIEKLQLKNPADIPFLSDEDIKSMSVSVEDLLGEKREEHSDYKIRLKNELFRLLLKGKIEVTFIQKFSDFSMKYVGKSNMSTFLGLEGELSSLLKDEIGGIIRIEDFKLLHYNLLLRIAHFIDLVGRE